jgi:hypothetical protein
MELLSVSSAGANTGCGTVLTKDAGRKAVGVIYPKTKPECRMIGTAANMRTMLDTAAAVVSFGAG